MTENMIHHRHNNCTGCNFWISASDSEESYVIFADFKTEERLYGFNWMCIHCWNNNLVIEWPYFNTLIHKTGKDLWREKHKV